MRLRHKLIKYNIFTFFLLKFTSSTDLTSANPDLLRQGRRNREGPPDFGRSVNPNPTRIQGGGRQIMPTTLLPTPLYFQTLPPALSQEYGTFMLGDIFSIQADLLHVKLMMSFNEKNIIMVYEIIKHRFQGAFVMLIGSNHQFQKCVFTRTRLKVNKSQKDFF